MTTQTEKTVTEGGGRDGSNVIASPGMPGATGAGRGRKDPPLEPPEGAWPWDTLILDFLVSRAVRE